MTRLKSELIKRGLMYDCDFMDCYEKEQEFVCIDNNYIICAYHCNVLAPELRIYDLNYNLVATQNLRPEPQCGLLFNKNKWESHVVVGDDNDFGFEEEFWF